MNLASDARVKWRSLLLTALIRVPSTASSRLRHHTGEPGRRRVEPINKGVDEPHRVLSADVVVDRLRQKQRLAAIVPGDVRHARILSRERPPESAQAEFSRSA
jgi:hypothetical protein